MTQPQNKITTVFVFCLLCALFYYIQKDVRRQVKEIRAEAEQVNLAPLPAGPATCPKSKFEGGSFFSQYYEDYILAYVFRDQDTGVYVDVGSAGPSDLSVTKRFYNNGWRGLNIDANPAYAQHYQKVRPGDRFINLGVSDEEGELIFYDCGPKCPVSTFSADNAAYISKTYGHKFTEKSIPVATMAQILKKHPQPQISFMNVDVEGWETQVLRGYDFSGVRPEVIVAESTKAYTETPNHQQWEPIVLNNNYVLAMNDGQNRYYLDRRSPLLIKRLNDFNFINMCVRQNKIRRNLQPASVGIPLLAR